MDQFAFLLPVIFTAFGITFLIVAAYGTASARFWGLGYLLAAAGFLMPIMPDIVPGQVRALVADTLFLCGLALIGQALSLHFHRPLPVWPRALLVPAGVAAAVIAIFVVDDPTLDATLNDGFALICLGLPLFMLRGRAKSAADRLLYGLAIAVALENLLRNLLLISLRSSPIAFDSFLSSTYAFLFQASAAILGLLLALSALAAVTLRTLGTYRDAAERDPLTGLLNRRGFARQAGAIETTGHKGTLIACDLDHFKRINDRFGHMIGDRVIAEFATLLHDTLPPGAIVARFGGEEFVCFLPSLPIAHAAHIAETMRLQFERSADLSAVGERVTASFGLSEWQVGEPNIDASHARADRALYAAKANGRNQVVRSDRLTAHALASRGESAPMALKSASLRRVN